MYLLIYCFAPWWLWKGWSSSWRRKWKSPTVGCMLFWCSHSNRLGEHHKGISVCRWLTVSGVLFIVPSRQPLAEIWHHWQLHWKFLTDNFHVWANSQSNRGNPDHLLQANEWDDRVAVSESKSALVWTCILVTSRQSAPVNVSRECKQHM